MKSGSAHPREPAPVRQVFELGSMRYPARCGLGTRRREETLEVTREPREAGRASDRVGGVQGWLEKLYRLCAEGKVDPAIDMVLDAMDDLIAASDLTRCNEILARADVERLLDEASIALLMETLRAKTGLLPARSDFYRRIEDKLRRQRASEADALLEGLR
ncbi:hypothetical protein [Sorangium sp. So ce1182]|uniref:hypothetical protein n=1 Tax=Sorangium sp. So ce1182 TaxID=3133334 RepID=UPI003F5F4387